MIVLYENIKTAAESNNCLISALNHINTKLRIKIHGHCLEQDKVTFTHKQMMNTLLCGCIYKVLILC